ncbi:hydroxymethylpyrimidine/phosphomethylpyrimidine kinase ThiD [Gottschalkia purinilytica]|uniref:Hydroxymethylpyrimidine/phosphomethylpyrimidine kinase n=1 Tax=Gottschalkia purinilytica TaxID=1503 RepID=A0A0L0WFD6_GOTPU|nr:bifunctional hydroxymethylpyrimidine kinase/phosphomethylpyrimidine kinase [Gottschalkia purinilytica]KNF10193.1 hydroxymethylpyrimidine/phosphomethylpyrimidine kinase ThiD [Gottschalkia purinilytica]
MKKVLTIAGSDSSGGAGIQADLKTFSAHGVFGMSVITAITAQNTQGVFGIQDITEDMIEQQIEVIYDDIEVDAVKIGMVSKIPTIKSIAKKLKDYNAKNIVIDPVMISKSGFNLLSPEAKETLISELIPISTMVTPNIPEATAITGDKVSNISDMKKAAKKIYYLGCKSVLVKGGHLDSDATDVLFDGKEFYYFTSSRILTKNTHGTGCTLSSAIASNLALGFDIPTSVKNAKKYITIAIENSLDIGKGVGPTHHFYELYKKAGL